MPYTFIPEQEYENEMSTYEFISFVNEYSPFLHLFSFKTPILHEIL